LKKSAVNSSPEPPHTSRIRDFGCKRADTIKSKTRESPHKPPLQGINTVVVTDCAPVLGRWRSAYDTLLPYSDSIWIVKRESVVRFVLVCSMLMVMTGCATQLTSYAPTANQSVVYDQGVGSITWETDEAVLTMYPTFRFQSPSDIPTFTLMVQNKTDHNIDFVPESIQAYLDDRDCHVYTLEERVGEIRSAAKRKQIALAVVGGLAAGAAAYGASHQTATYSSYSVVGYHQFWTSGTIQTYDPAAGIFAGVAVGAATGVGIHQLAKAAGYEIQAARRRPSFNTTPYGPVRPSSVR
jgi:hypothetical protein